MKWIAWLKRLGPETTWIDFHLHASLESMQYACVISRVAREHFDLVLGEESDAGLSFRLLPDPSNSHLCLAKDGPSA